MAQIFKRDDWTASVASDLTPFARRGYPLSIGMIGSRRPKLGFCRGQVSTAVEMGVTLLQLLIQRAIKWVRTMSRYYAINRKSTGS